MRVIGRYGYLSHNWTLFFAYAMTRTFKRVDFARIDPRADERFATMVARSRFGALDWHERRLTPLLVCK